MSQFQWQVAQDPAGWHDAGGGSGADGAATRARPALAERRRAQRAEVHAAPAPDRGAGSEQARRAGQGQGARGRRAGGAHAHRPGDAGHRRHDPRRARLGGGGRSARLRAAGAAAARRQHLGSDGQRADTVFYEKEGRLYLSSVRFRDDQHIMRIIERIVAPLGRRVDESSPMVDARCRTARVST